MIAALDEEELGKRPEKPPANMEKMSVAELENYILILHQEIARAQAEIKTRQSVRGNADALFKK